MNAINSPKRFKRMRTRGWRKPAGSRCVQRPGRYGNPFKVGAPDPGTGTPMTAKDAVAHFERQLLQMAPAERALYLEPLRGRDLGCTCDLDQPCHADVLLRYANGEEDEQ